MTRRRRTPIGTIISSPILWSLLIAVAVLVNLMVCQRHLSAHDDDTTTNQMNHHHQRHLSSTEAETTKKNQKGEDEDNDLRISSFHQQRGDDVNRSNLQQQLLSQQVVVDDLVWHVPRPKIPRNLGWEDDFMTQWKQKNYDPSRKASCIIDLDHSPYAHYLKCHMPAYIPARLPLLSPQQSQNIPRVLFLSWFTRDLGRRIFTSVLSLLHHNPEYELVFFTDNDVDAFVCAEFPELAPYFFGLASGAARTDVWRMLVMEKYGGVYLDLDTSALGHLPISRYDDVVSGLGCWSHVPSRKQGLLEHWALAFTPHHALITTTLDIIRENLRNPNNTRVQGEDAKKRENSYVMRLTGPATYQRALHRLLRQSDCALDGKSYCMALRDPQSHCNYTTFTTLFGNLTMTQEKDLNNSITQKMLDSDEERSILGHKHYDNDEAPKYVPPTMLTTTTTTASVAVAAAESSSSQHSSNADVCSPARLAAGRAKREQQWLDAIERAKVKRNPNRAVVPPILQ
jgi:Glycosyltransferase sugar-binding region containing DXD motif